MKDALGITATPREVKVALSPAQQRLVEEDKYPGPPPEDYSAGVLDAAEAYEFFGSPQLAPPPGSPDGTPVPLPPPKSEAARQHAKRPAASPTSSSSVQTPNEQAAVLSAAAREGKRLVRGAQASGTADAETLSAGTRLAERIARGLRRL